MQVAETGQEAQSIDLTTLPADAFPAGTDPASYVAGLNGKQADDTSTETGAAKERPTNVPEKFWDAEKGEMNLDAFLTSYSELEKKLIAPKEEKADTLKIDKADGQADQTAEPAPVASAIETFKSAYEANAGQVTEAAFEAIVNAGIPLDVVQTYVAGLEALSQQTFASAYEVAGGKDAFETAIEWAKTNLTDAEADAYDKMVDQKATMRQGIEWLMTKYKAGNPSEGSFVQAESATASGDIFRSRDEMMEAIRAPNYSDPAVQKDILEKIARSKAAGTL